MADLEGLRAAILSEFLSGAAFDGWTITTLEQAARTCGASQTDLAAAFPNQTRDVATFWSETADAAILSAMSGDEFAGLKIREKVKEAVWARITFLTPEKEAARRCAAFLAMPQNHDLAASLTWKTASTIWRGIERSIDRFQLLL